MDLTPLIERAMMESASDIHLREGYAPRLRIDGELYDVKNLKPTKEDLRKFIYPMLGEFQIKHFEENLELDFAYGLGQYGRLRGNLFQEQNRFCAVLRLLPNIIPSLQDIGMPKSCVKFCDLQKGLVLVTGPTGSGKSTTLAAMINEINKHRRCHIQTVEDPIEFVYAQQMATITQREVGRDTKDFAAALRHSVRQDPDVVLIGEMRDQETMKVTITLAETGHLALSTLHTGEASQTINRIIDNFDPHQQNQVRFQLSMTLEGIISQLLIRTQNGRGRIAAREVLVCTRAVKNLIREGKIPQIYSAMQTGQDEGMITMINSLGDLFQKGIISYEDALHAAFDKKEFVAKYG
ncbi:type IV pilus twitching motility protein PilT [Candidatus Sumerlaeota bacterium]|nr:type IV pilus twitching motility protein PilT [Candidatus Sumerlaeota bacterium]